MTTSLFLSCPKSSLFKYSFLISWGELPETVSFSCSCATKFAFQEKGSWEKKAFSIDVPRSGWLGMKELP
jgi:hypothetical protein